MQFNDLPVNIVDRTKEVLLDSIGCAPGGYVTERAKIAIQLSESLSVKPEATIIGYRKASCPQPIFSATNLLPQHHEVECG